MKSPDKIYMTPSYGEPSSDDLKKEVKKYISKDTPELWTGDDDYEYTSVPLCWMYDFARYFAEWGAEHTKEKSENPIPNNAEEAAKEYARYHYADTFSQELAENDFLAGSAWNEMHMMKEVVEMEVGMFGKHLPMLIVTEPMEMKDFPAKHGQTVRVIVLPKDDSHE